MSFAAVDVSEESEMIQTLNIADLRARFEGRRICLLSCLSFEERSLIAPKAFAEHGLISWLCFKSADSEMDNDVNIKLAQSLSVSANFQLSFMDVLRRDPLTLADQAVAALDSGFSSSSHLVVDITTMTHEMLLIVMAALAEMSRYSRDLTVIYNIAADYSTNSEKFNQKWISRGIQTVRSVIGYSGLSSPGLPTTLLALPGLDLERIRNIAEALEPERLIVGIGKPGNGDHRWLHNRNVAVAEHLVGMIGGDVFEYDAYDPIQTARSVEEALQNVRENVVICPLNSKVSTVGAGMVALNHPNWQVCYAPALVYNIKYSAPSEEFSVFSYNETRAAILALPSKTAAYDRNERHEAVLQH